MHRFLAPLIFGIGGVAVLVSLGLWQMQRLAWKEAVLAEISARIGAEPVDLPAEPVREADNYLPVRVSGTATGEALFAVTSVTDLGPGFRLISAFETGDGRRILVDEGYIPSAARETTRSPQPMTVTGNLHWPEEGDRFTPAPEASTGIWYARDVAGMAAVLGTEPVLVVASAVVDGEPRALPQPVTTDGIPNNHLGYAIQWFGLALVWAGMTLFLLWRIHRRTV